MPNLKKRFFCNLLPLIMHAIMCMQILFPFVLCIGSGPAYTCQASLLDTWTAALLLMLRGQASERHVEPTNDLASWAFDSWGIRNEEGDYWAYKLAMMGGDDVGDKVSNCVPCFTARRPLLLLVWFCALCLALVHPTFRFIQVNNNNNAVT